jgi:hypothetical protein
VAEAAGFDGLTLPDHLFYPVEVSVPYPASADGVPPFRLDTGWPDVWVVFGALAAVTSRLRFRTAVHVLSLRHPLVVAPASAPRPSSPTAASSSVRAMATSATSSTRSRCRSTNEGRAPTRRSSCLEPSDAESVDDHVRLADLGLTSLAIAPWGDAYAPPSVERRAEEIERFAQGVIAPVRTRTGPTS